MVSRVRFPPSPSMIMLLTIQVLSAIGMLLSAYALRVEIRKKQNKDYKAMCDINDKVSCTKAFSSKYGRILLLPNSFYGIIFYLAVIALSIFNLANIIFYLAIISFIGTLYLIYVLYFKVKSFCLVCNGIYIINILLLIFSYFSFA